MSHPKCRDTDYIDFLIAMPRGASCCEAARSQPPAPDPPAHDAYSRLLTRLEPDPETLYREAEPLVSQSSTRWPAGMVPLHGTTPFWIRPSA